MIHILLVTLKVLGILLAITLGLIVSLVLIVLFVPIRYKADINNTNVVAKVTWLLHLVSIKVEFIEMKLKYKIKIFGIPLNFDKKEKKIEKKEKIKKTLKSQNVDNAKSTVKDKKAVKIKSSDVDKMIKDIDNEEKVIVTEKKSFIQKIIDKIVSIKEKIYNKVKELYEKVIKVKDKVKIYKKFLTTREARANIKQIFTMFLDLLLYILPTKLEGNVKFGLGNPENTGKTLGIICMFYGVYGDKVDLEPDFDNKVFDARIKFKGRIRLYRLLIVAFKLWRNIWIKKLIKFVKTH